MKRKSIATNFSLFIAAALLLAGPARAHAFSYGDFFLNPGVSVGPGSNEIVQQRFRLNTAAQNAINTAIKNRTRLAYKLTGEITSSEPRSRYDIKYESALNAVPGLSGTLR